MKQDPFTKYLYQRGTLSDKNKVELQLSQSDKEESKPRTRQLKLGEMFNSRKTTRDNTSNTQTKLGNKSKYNLFFQPRQITRQRQKHEQNQQIQKFPQAVKTLQESMDDYLKKKKSLQQNQIVKGQTEVPIYMADPFQNIRPIDFENKQQLIEEQKRLMRLKRKQQRAEQEKRKNQQSMRKKTLTFKRFLKNISRNTQKTNEKQAQKQFGKLNNISMFNKIEEQNGQGDNQDEKKIENSICKVNDGLVYKKLTMQRQKIPTAFLKILLSYKFTVDFPTQQTKRVPNSFEDQTTYKKIFHYLVVNECIADIHLRIQAISEGTSTLPIPVVLSNFKSLSNGFIEFSMNQPVKQVKKSNQQQSDAKNNEQKEQKPKQITQQKGSQKIGKQEKIMLKNLSLSRNRLGLITNAKNFRFQHFGIPCQRNDRIFSFLCMLVTPQSKQDLRTQIKALANIEPNDLDIIFKKNKTTKAFFYDLEKISTHLRQYDAITHLYDTEVAPFIYNPVLIEKKHLDMIHQKQRYKLEPILQKLKVEYNNTQYQSIRQMALRQSGIVLLQGPPGTGKTTTLMGLLAAEYEYFKNICRTDDKKKILICAPSNAAIDHITKRLVCQGLIAKSSQKKLDLSLDASHIQNSARDSCDRVFPNVLRVGIVETDDPDIIKVSLDDICDRKITSLKKSSIKNNYMTTTQIRQKILYNTKQISKIRAMKDIQEWEKQNKIANLKYENRGYETQLFNFRKERVQLKQTYTQIQNQQFHKADIILTTLSSSGSQRMEKVRGYIGCLIVDQAAQSTQPTILIPFQSGVKKILLIGDPCQLPSTTMSQDSSVTLFNRSLFQRVLDNGVKPYFLNIQYRMAPLIRQFPSNVFYNNRLIDAQSVLQRYKPLNNQNSIPSQNNEQNTKAISEFFNRNSIFIDVKFGEQQFHHNSYRNVAECLVVKKLLLNFIKKTKLSIGVITPYQSQKKHLINQLKKQLVQKVELANQLLNFHDLNQSKVISQDRNDEQENSGIFGEPIEEEQQQSHEQNKQKILKLQKEKKRKKKYVQKKQPSEQKHTKIHKRQQKMNENQKQQQQQRIKNLQQLLHERIMINTVDSFQGQQKDIIIVSTVRSNNKKQIGFMKDQRRINVALTRSKHLLIVVGQGDTIGSNQIWNKYLQWSEGHKCYYQINQRESVSSQISMIHKGYNQNRVLRIRHKKLTRDLRRQQIQQIKRQDFGMGANGNKKIKKQKNVQNQTSNSKKQKPIYVEKVQQKPKLDLQKKMQNEDEKRNEQMLEEKRAREQQAVNLQEVNRRIRQLQQSMATDKKSPYARLFQTRHRYY